jgi:hypothetical protein
MRGFFYLIQLSGQTFFMGKNRSRNSEEKQQK